MTTQEEKKVLRDKLLNQTNVELPQIMANINLFVLKGQYKSAQTGLADFIKEINNLSSNLREITK